MIIVGISDIHGSLSQIDIPSGDVLVLAGDILNNYSRDSFIDAQYQLQELHKLNLSFYNLKKEMGFKKILFVAGNHDWIFQVDKKAAIEALPEAEYLEDSYIVYKGIKFYGSPWQLYFYNWAFNFPYYETEQSKSRPEIDNIIKRTWGNIPDDTNVLVTHGPPLGVRDINIKNENCGDPVLLNRVKEVEPKFHIFGHIHYSYGNEIIPNCKTIFSNVAIMGENYKPINKPLVATI